MKRAVFALVLFMILLASAAVAQSASQKGLSVLFSVGDDRRAIEALVVFNDQAGAILTPNNGILVVPEGELVNVQVFPKGATGATDFIIGWSTDTVMAKNPKKAEFDAKYGWWFVLTPQDLAQSPGFTRALQLRMIDRDGIKSSVTAIFKITYGSKWLTQYDQLIIKTVPRSEMNVASSISGTDATVAVEAIKANQQKIVDRVNDNDVRLINLENWAKSASGNNSAATSSAQMITFPVNFTGSFIGLKMKILLPDGRTQDYLVKTNVQTVSLPVGKNVFELEVNHGGGVIRQKKPIIVEVFSDTNSVKINVGGAGR